jgi:hypothetical protein
LRQYVFANTQSNLVLLKELFIITQLLEENEIEFATFKGLMIMQMVYHDLSLRRCGDIDILVREQDFPRTKALFLSLGFQRTLTDRIERQSMQAGLRHEGRKLEVDLHWGIPPRILNIKSDILIDSAAPLSIGGKMVSSFSLEDMFIISCVNAIKEYWHQRLYPYSDIHEFLQGDIKLDWDSILSRAEELGCLRPLKVALLTTSRLYDISLPTAIKDELTPDISANLVKQELLRQLIPVNTDNSNAIYVTTNRKLYYFDSNDAYFVALMDNALKRFSQPFLKLIKPNERDKSIVALPKMFSFLYYLIRPFRVIAMKLIKLTRK